MALFSQVIVAEAPKGGKGGKGGGGGGLKFTVREEGAAEPVTVSIHPSSVNAKASHIGLQPLSHRVAAPITCTCHRLHAHAIVPMHMSSSPCTPTLLTLLTLLTTPPISEGEPFRVALPGVRRDDQDDAGTIYT